MNHGEPTQPPMNQYKCTETGNEIMIVTIYILPATGKLANSTTIYILILKLAYMIIIIIIIIYHIQNN